MNKIIIKKEYLRKHNQITLPHSIEAEQSILGSLMLDNCCWEKISECVAAEDFYLKSHQSIFSEMQHLQDKVKPIDLITLTESLENRGKLEVVGGFSYLAELPKNTPSTANIIYYAKIVKEHSNLRKIIDVSDNLRKAVFNPQGKTSKDIIGAAESYIINHLSTHYDKSKETRNIADVLDEAIIQIEKKGKLANRDITGLNTGYDDLNKKTSGLQPSELVILAARPSMGKTTLAMNLVENIAMLQEKPVLVFSLEMSSEQIAIRSLASLSRVDQARIRTGQLNDKDWAQISSAVNVLLKKNNIYINDSSQLTVARIRSDALKISKKKNGLALIMVDYLQLMSTPYTLNNRNLEITEISRSLKSLAKEFKVPVLALSQLNRSLEQRADKRPVNADLRDSGAIEQDADLVMFIYRDEVYYENSDLKNIAEIIIGKQRNGPTGKLRLIFNSKWSRFDNYTELEIE